MLTEQKNGTLDIFVALKKYIYISTSVSTCLPAILSNWYIQLGFPTYVEKNIYKCKKSNFSYLLFAKFSKQPSINLIRICLSVNQHTKEQSSFSASFINPSERWIYSK